MMLPLKKHNQDDFQTPPEALDYLLPFIKKEWRIWECAEGKGNLTTRLRELGFNVIGTDKLTGIDFLTYEATDFDCIVTNPPYSLKNEFLERCYWYYEKYNKKFCLLLPLTALETRRRQKLFKKYGVEIILLPKRINFITPSGKGSGAWFAVAWFTCGLNIGKQLNFF